MTHFKVWRQFRAWMIVADGLCVLLTYFLADYLRCRLFLHTAWPEMIDGRSGVREHLKVLALVPPAWPVILACLGWYDLRWRSGQWILQKSLAGSLILTLLMSALALLFAREHYPRSQIGALAALLPATTSLVRGINLWFGRRLGPRLERRVLIVGTGRDALRLRRLLRWGVLGQSRIVGHLTPPWQTEIAAVRPGDVVGDIDRLVPILDGQVVDEVVFTAQLADLPQVLRFARLCEEIGVAALVQAESIACHSMPELISLHGVPLLSYAPAQHSPELLAVKRILDIALAITGILLTAPIMGICATLIKALSPGPILFYQKRSGLNGRLFDMYKFRTMQPNAEARLAEVAHLNEIAGPAFKATNDPRVTRIGASLRRWSLDELPQLFNVLKGDMSIVGPRPPIPSEVEKYDRWQRRRLSMRPGLTCLWQVQGRHRIGFNEWMQLDLFYIDHWSLKLDFLIMWKTIPTVLAGSGA